MPPIEKPAKSEYNADMNRQEPALSDATLMSGIGILAFLAVTILGIQLLDPGWVRAVGIALLLIFGILLIKTPRSAAPAWQWHVYLGIQTALVCGLLLLQPKWGVFPMLFFILGPTAMLTFPRQSQGFLWIGIFTAATAVIFFATAAPREALLTLLPFSAGYWFFGTFARAMRNADDARKDSQRLLAELQAAHQQLQAYAAQVEELAVSEERNRMAREMHDTLGHRLTVAAVQLEGAQRLIPRDPQRAAGMVETGRSQVRDALADLRQTVATLREPLATDLPLETALPRLVASFQQATDLQVELELPEQMPVLSHLQRLAVYRAAQEALTNIQRHAQASQACLKLEIIGDCLELQVRDDGVGFPEDVKAAAFGLRGLRERATQLGGSLALEDDSQGGARLRFRLPLAKEVAPDGENPHNAC
ncbi:MAG: sensor histidine kinase [Anaerolineales bacterium]|nr:sensor histidine kinase [Anaerolineales bacterium]